MYQRELSFMEACKKVYLKNYFNFEGRASRSEFWWAYLGQYAVSMVVYMISMFFCGFLIPILAINIDSDMDEATFFGILFLSMIPMIIFGLAIAIPMLGVSARRLHDIGKSGWWYLISLIPFGGLLLIYWWAQPSEMRPNQYGEVPNLEESPYDMANYYNNPQW